MDRVYYVVLSVPAGTPSSAPSRQVVKLEDAILKRIECVVPDGHCGLTGVQLLQSQQVIFPWSNNAYIIANDERIIFEYDDEIQASGMVAQGYNTDIFTHSFYFRFTITDLPLPGQEEEAAANAAVAPESNYVPEGDEFDVDNILASSDDTGDETGESGEPVTETPPITTTPILTPAPPTVPVRKPRPVRRKLGVR
jgi:hypothetical protein